MNRTHRKTHVRGMRLSSMVCQRGSACLAFFVCWNVLCQPDWRLSEANGKLVVDTSYFPDRLRPFDLPIRASQSGEIVRLYERWAWANSDRQLPKPYPNWSRISGKIVQVLPERKGMLVSLEAGDEIVMVTPAPKGLYDGNEVAAWLEFVGDVEYTTVTGGSKTVRNFKFGFPLSEEQWAALVADWRREKKEFEQKKASEVARQIQVQKKLKEERDAKAQQAIEELRARSAAELKSLKTN